MQIQPLPTPLLLFFLREVDSLKLVLVTICLGSAEDLPSKYSAVFPVGISNLPHSFEKLVKSEVLLFFTAEADCAFSCVAYQT